jgi:hypothetical protein
MIAGLIAIRSIRRGDGYRVIGLLCWVFTAEADAQGPRTASQPAEKVVAALRLPTGESIRLDGVLDEAVWQQVAVATDFRQRDPDNGAPATERTEVRLVFDDHRLILGVMLHDTEPDRVLGNQMQRDQSFDADDRFMWTIDTFLDGRTGYFFEINPSGAMGDGLVDAGSDPGFDNDFGVAINRSWDGIWKAQVRRTNQGWSAEIEMPFRTMNFDPRAASWGVNFQRTVRRKNEDSLWTGHARNQGLARMSNAGQVVGIRDISQGLGLDLKPYAVGNLSSAPGRGRPGALTTGDVGMDLFYNLTPALRANVSVNTDFAETEVDQRRVNLTRFPLFFEEKRDFFLEGSGYFDFAREPDEAVVPFFSRRIGLDDTGTPQRIDVGAKMTGQIGPFDVGALQVRTGESGAVPGEDFSVFRVRQRALEQSYVGALYTRRAARLPGEADRHTAGLDFALQTSRFRGDKNLQLSGFYVWTSTPLDTGNGAAYGLRASYPNDPFTFELALNELQRGYDPAVGFVERRGYKRLNPSADWAPRLDDHPWIRGFEFSFDLDFQNDAANRPLTRNLEFTPFELNFEDGSRFAVDVSRHYERLEEDFEISDGVVLPYGQVYRFTRYQIGGSTAEHRMVDLNADYTFGDFFSGRRRELGIEVGIRPARGVALAIEAERNLLDLAEGRFATDVYRVLASTQFSPWLSLANNLQYDTVSRQLGWQARFRWIQRPGNDLFLVYTHNWRETATPAGRRFETLDNRAASKIVYTWRF